MLRPTLTGAIAKAMACLACTFTAACASDPPKVRPNMLSLTEIDDGQTLDVRVGEPVEIALPENASTGYRWAIERYDEEAIEASAIKPLYPSNNSGAGGQAVFTFQGKKVGSGTIVLKRWRHWEGDDSVIGRFRLRLTILP